MSIEYSTAWTEEQLQALPDALEQVSKGGALDGRARLWLSRPKFERAVGDDGHATLRLTVGATLDVLF